MADVAKSNDQPGFHNPFAVVQHCVTLLLRDVYTNLELAKFDADGNKAKLKDPCSGIKLYLNPIENYPDVIAEVPFFIQHQRISEMVRIINNDNSRALCFMLEYLRLRGAFIKWRVNLNNLTTLSSSRSVIRYGCCYLESLPENEFCASVSLGKYVNKLLCVSYAYEMYFMKDLLSKLYGPIFIKLIIENDIKDKISDQKAIEYSIGIFRNMLESCPWHRYNPKEAMKQTIYPDIITEFTYKYTELSNYIDNTSTLPNKYQSNMVESIHKARLNQTDQQSMSNNEQSRRGNHIDTIECKIDFK